MYNTRRTDVRRVLAFRPTTSPEGHSAASLLGGVCAGVLGGGTQLDGDGALGLQRGVGVGAIVLGLATRQPRAARPRGRKTGPGTRRQVREHYRAEFDRVAAIPAEAREAELQLRSRSGCSLSVVENRIAPAQWRSAVGRSRRPIRGTAPDVEDIQDGAESVLRAGMIGAAADLAFGPEWSLRPGPPATCRYRYHKSRYVARLA
jgi:hypothetical protein